ncbi:MAG TPA: aminotransferase, partial [Nocardioides sp.]|nr:aminotransferase [Nocardioides sp.]
MIRDFTDDEARRALALKWGSVDPDVIPAWVAEMDYALAPSVADALAEAVARGLTGYPRFPADGPLGEAYAGFAARHFGQKVDPELVIPTVDVTAGVRLALDVLSEPGAMVLPLPAYHPQLDVAEITGRERVDLPVSPDADRAVVDLDRLDQ